MTGGIRLRVPGVAVALAGAGVAFLIHLALPAVPWLTAAFVIGFVAAAIPPVRPALDGVLRSGLAFSARTLLRAGIVLLGLDLAIGDVAALGITGVAAIVGLVVIAFAATYGIARALRLPGDEPVLLAAGFSICGVSAVGAMSAARGRSSDDTATPTALVTLFGTAAIAVLPALAQFAAALGAPMSPEFFGAWVGASVHDVGQVVATAQTAGAAALAAAIVVKLTRVLMLAPMVAVASVRTRRAARAGGTGDAALPPIVPLFIVGFVLLVLVRTFVPVPDLALDVADTVRNVLLAAALVGIGASLRLERLVRTGGRAVLAAAASWAVILVLGWGVAFVVTS
ncbi:YeiH family protein [Homoserinibacter sp. GY 40078]|uniref:YeiH family protein n=1 Tax=Homoserinibacter sp. GY 40078 TaxID=2603275 RepID=UPI0011C8B47F|nr:putative sulfate exporter family transporter [Homoserinibacter sp. GY 40078]TXK16336.1 putative sulfate exporter family transporter [Homoserinibacter sp. GY 40078]